MRRGRNHFIDTASLSPKVQEAYLDARERFPYLFQDGSAAGQLSLADLPTWLSPSTDPSLREKFVDEAKDAVANVADLARKIFRRPPLQSEENKVAAAQLVKAFTPLADEIGCLIDASLVEKAQQYNEIPVVCSRPMNNRQMEWNF